MHVPQAFQGSACGGESCSKGKHAHQEGGLMWQSSHQQPSPLQAPPEWTPGMFRAHYSPWPYMSPPQPSGC